MPAGPWPETLAARDAADGLLQAWDEEVAKRLLAPNVDLDQPLTARQADIATLRQRIGSFHRNEERAAECESPACCRWWLTGPGGTVAAQIELAPLRQPLIQQLSVAIPPDPDSPLGRALAALVGVVTAEAGDWPEGLAVAGGLRTAELLRQLRMAAVWAGSCTLDSYLAGDGATTSTVRLAGDSGRVDLALEVGGTGQLVRCAIALGV
jgi:hypothetical protein